MEQASNQANRRHRTIPSLRVCVHWQFRMLTEISSAPVSDGIMILQSGSRRRSWSDKSGPRLRDKNDFVASLGPRISCVAVPGKSTERITINISGKKYEMTHRRLLKFPRSLLARAKRRASFYDAEKDEFFFDRNRMAFESVYHFYQTAGEFLRPEHIPNELLLKEMEFFGLTDYLSQRARRSMSVNSPCRRRRIPTNKYQRVVWELFENPGSSILARVLHGILLLLILLSLVLLCIETLPAFSDANMSPTSRNAITGNQELTKVNMSTNNGRESDNKDTDGSSLGELRKLFIVEAFCVACFTLELLLRYVVSPDKLRFFCSLLNIFDLLAVLPFYVTIAFSKTPASIQSAYVLRVMRLMRVFRFAKIYRYSSAVQIFVQTIRECVSDFMMLGFFILTTSVVFASCSYFFEHDNEGTNFVSIPAACWWALVTLSTIGYGDMVPVTLGGKISGALCVVSGVIIITPVLPIIASKFSRIQEKAKLTKTTAAENDSDDGSSESSEQAVNTFSASLVTASVPMCSARPRSITVI